VLASGRRKISGKSSIQGRHNLQAKEEHRQGIRMDLNMEFIQSIFLLKPLN
jgi:hypothetical protein